MQSVNSSANRAAELGGLGIGMDFPKLAAFLFTCCLLKTVVSSSCPPNPPSCPSEDCSHWSELEFSIFHNCTDQVVQLLDQVEQWNWECGLRCDAIDRRSELQSFRQGLEIAAGSGHTEIVAEILQRREKLGIELKGCEKASWMAAENDHTDVLELLLEAGSGIAEAVESCNVEDIGPAPSLLFAAARGGSVESLKLLIDSGANLDVWGDCHRSSRGCGTVLEESMRRYQSPPEVAIHISPVQYRIGIFRCL